MYVQYSIVQQVGASTPLADVVVVAGLGWVCGMEAPMTLVVAVDGEGSLGQQGGAWERERCDAPAVCHDIFKR